MAREYLRLQFTFTHEQDVQRYGAGPYLYDEYQIVALPGRKLVDIEGRVGMTMAAMLNGVRISSAIADLAATWTALYLAGREGLPDFGDYDAHALLIEWSAAPAPESGKDEAPATTSERSDVVSLSPLPRVG